MRTSKKFILNGIILTGTSLLMRWIGVMFNTYISNRLGSEGMGIYGLVQSVFGFAVTFACSGINFGATRLISESLANENWGDIKNALKKCVFYSLFFSLSASLIVSTGADFIGRKILEDIRTVKSIKILAISLPFISLSSVFNGYFSAVRRVYKNATVLIIEQFIQIFFTVKFISLFALKNVEYACVAIALGILISELISLMYNCLLCYFDIKKHSDTSSNLSAGMTKKLIKISLPLALSTYFRSGLVTIEHLLIPYGLRKSGASYATSMSTYGLVHGMVFPIIMFPSCIIYSFSGLLVPELAAFNEKKEYDKINKMISRAIQYSIYFSVGVSCVIMCYAYELSMVFYNSAEAYEYIRLFAPLITIMYLDGTVDGILKGLNEQLYSMKINIADALISVLLVYFLVPHFGVKGYIVAIFVCEIFNCTMSLMRLVKISQPEISFSKYVFKPIISALVSTWVVVCLFDFLDITFWGSKFNLVSRISCTLLLYSSVFFYKRRCIKENNK